jgi:hypothetical protein
MLCGGQVFEQVSALRECFFLEFQETFDERFHAVYLQ